MKCFPLLLLMCVAIMSFNVQDIPVPDKNDVAVGSPSVSLVDRELVLDYEIRFGGNVLSCDVDVIVLADKVPYRFTKYYSGDYGRVTSPGRKQVRFNIASYKELLAGRDIKFRIDVVRRELNDNRILETTPAVTMPEVVTSPTISKAAYSVVCGGTVISDGGSAVISKGVVWSNSPNPTLSLDTKTDDGRGTGDFISTVHHLQPGTKYYVRAYATNSVGTVYGTEQYFTTMFDRPSVETSYVSSVTTLSAIMNGNIISDGGETPYECGFYWSSRPFSDASSATKQPGTVSGTSFSTSLTGLTPSTEYYYQAYSTNSAGTSTGEVRSFTTGYEMSSALDLSSKGTANCYIVSKSGVYKFPAVKGNSSESVGNVVSCDVLWESFGTDKVPKIGDLVRNIASDGQYISFQASSPFCEGNAVIAAKDANGNILWSWHIWLTDVPVEQTYYNGAGVMMDRNLGATSATPGDVGALGLLYQWGRKDPFLGLSHRYKSRVAKSTLKWPASEKSDMNTGTVAYATAHPTTFLTSNDENKDWCYSDNESADVPRWHSDKTVYDPCPAGWRVPGGGDGEERSFWSKAFGKSSGLCTMQNTKCGINFSGKFGSAAIIWYPMAGILDDEGLLNTGPFFYYRSIYPSGLYATLSAFNLADVYTEYNFSPANGMSVRCQKE